MKHNSLSQYSAKKVKLSDKSLMKERFQVLWASKNMKKLLGDGIGAKKDRFQQ